jgi:hypothetical protein
LATACPCKEKRSFISLKIIQRNKLLKHLEDRGGQSIRLTWKPQTPGKGDYKKTSSTRFWVVQDHKITFDLAVGTGWDGPDDIDESDDSEELNDESHTSDNGDEGGNDAALDVIAHEYNAPMTSPRILRSKSSEVEMLRRVAEMNLDVVMALRERETNASWEQAQYDSQYHSPLSIKRPHRSSRSSTSSQQGPSRKRT